MSTDEAKPEPGTQGPHRSWPWGWCLRLRDRIHRRRDRIPRTQSLIDMNLDSLDTDYCLIKAEVSRLKPKPKNPENRYTEGYSARR